MAIALGGGNSVPREAWLGADPAAVVQELWENSTLNGVVPAETVSLLSLLRTQRPEVVSEATRQRFTELGLLEELAELEEWAKTV